MSAGHDLSVTRYVAAPPEVVWAMWTDRLEEWWCPRPWATEVVERDERPGGRSAMIMRGPNGEEHAMEGVFLEVVPGRRIVFTDAIRAGWEPQGPFMIGILDFAPEGDGTRYTGTARHWTAEAKAQHEAMGFTEGWGKVADQLAALAEAAVR